MKDLGLFSDWKHQCILILEQITFISLGFYIKSKQNSLQFTAFCWT